MRTGGDKEILAALKPFEKTQVAVALTHAGFDGRYTIAKDGGFLTWTDPKYNQMLQALSAVMVRLGYKKGREARIVADAYMCGYVRGLRRGARAFRNENKPAKSYQKAKGKVR